ncbi:hypothetical protein NEF87_004326 [Candidatus Lokiarchaeum ossiferum]|uniref:Glycosyltransferase 2-like domain-containing protein n=1 Tax=Candidatus Lokiarchaeum ossiferum TaxID=2951803 RepID=A0ABY6HWY7_9ARCH|nr:hypothetical protein NEF87_004326 [Candidatus Lokiarchaeum sp. B-35]
MSRNEENLTIIIPTYNRPLYLERCLGYFNFTKCKYKIIVADSSCEKNKELNEIIIAKFPDINICYNNSFTLDTMLFRKIKTIIDQIETEYCVICADDDFIIPNKIKNSLNFLNSNPSFTAVAGYSIVFINERNIFKKPKVIWQNYHQQLFPYMNNTNENMKLRLNQTFSHYFPTFYYFHRTKFLKMIFEETLKFTNDYRFGELFPALTTTIHGKIKTLDFYSGAREFLEQSDGKVAEKISDFIEKGTYDHKFSKFKAGLVENILKTTNLSKVDAIRQIDEGMQLYLKIGSNLKKKKNGSSSFLTVKIRKIVVNIILSIKNSKINKIIRKKRFWAENFPEEEYFDDVRVIKNYLVHFYEIHDSKEGTKKL